MAQWQTRRQTKSNWWDGSFDPWKWSIQMWTHGLRSQIGQQEIKSCWGCGRF